MSPTKIFHQVNDRILFRISLILSLVGSWFSIGFYHPDEQFYAIDFAAHKIGWLQEIQTWEHQNQIRPWLLPTIFAPFLALAKALDFSPFFGVWVLRAISAIFSWWALCQLNKRLAPYFHQKFFYLFFIFATHFSFFCFFMRLRTTSENWATTLFLLGLIPLLKKNIMTKDFLTGGLLLGLAFSLRHQLGLMALGIGIWILLNKKESAYQWFLTFCPAIFLGVSIGILSDIYGYREWTLTPWNYIYHNLVLDKISNFGISPFYSYFTWSLKHLHLWGVMLLVGLWAAIRNPKDWVCWTILPFLLAHVLIGHKELRFLYPLTYLLLFQSILFMQNKNWRRPWFVNTLVVLNGFFLLFTLFKPAHTPINFYQYLYFNKIEKIYVFNDPDGPRPILEMKFYTRPNLQVHVHPEAPLKKGYYLTTKYRDLDRFKKHNCQALYTPYPSWIFKLNFFNWIERSNIWTLTQC